MALTVPDPNVTALRELMTELLADKSTRQHIADLMAGADVGHETTDDHPMSGRRVPDLALGNGKRVADLMCARSPPATRLRQHCRGGVQLVRPQ
jgi:hypothetical protein